MASAACASRTMPPHHALDGSARMALQAPASPLGCMCLSRPHSRQSPSAGLGSSSRLSSPLRFARAFPCPSSSRAGDRRRGGLAPCRALFGLGLPELLVIGGVAVVLFGPKQLPEIGKSLGKTVKGFQEAAKEFQTELKEAAKSDSDADAASDGAPTAKAAEKPASAPAEAPKGDTK